MLAFAPLILRANNKGQSPLFWALISKRSSLADIFYSCMLSEFCQQKNATSAKKFFKHYFIDLIQALYRAKKYDEAKQMINKSKIIITNSKFNEEEKQQWLNELKINNIKDLLYKLKVYPSRKFESIIKRHNQSMPSENCFSDYRKRSPIKVRKRKNQSTPTIMSVFQFYPPHLNLPKGSDEECKNKNLESNSNQSCSLKK